MPPSEQVYTRIKTINNDVKNTVAHTHTHTYLYMVGVYNCIQYIYINMRVYSVYLDTISALGWGLYTLC